LEWWKWQVGWNRTGIKKVKKRKGWGVFLSFVRKCKVIGVNLLIDAEMWKEDRE